MAKRNELFERLLANIPNETKERVWKEMSCKWYYNGGDRKKGLPGTPCSIVGCVAWEQNPDIK
jgi:hypothetical protein